MVIWGVGYLKMFHCILCWILGWGLVAGFGGGGVLWLFSAVFVIIQNEN